MSRLDTEATEEGLLSQRDPEAAPFCSPAEAATYLGVTPQIFDGMRKSHGLGRYHLSREHNQIVYSLNDLARLRKFLEAAPSPPPEPVKPSPSAT